MKLKIINSTSHWVMPRIVMGILVVLLVIIGIPLQEDRNPFHSIKELPLLPARMG